MQVSKLIIKNFRLITDAEIELDKPLIVLYGDVLQGKTSFLDAVKLLFKKGAYKDLIQHGKTRAMIKIEFEGGWVKREWYIDKYEQTASKGIEAFNHMQKLNQAQAATLFNPFQADAKFFYNSKPPERTAYLVQLLGIDVEHLNFEINQTKEAASELRQELKHKYGEIDLTFIAEPQIAQLREQKNKADIANKALLEQYDKHKQEAKDYNTKVSTRDENRQKALDKIKEVNLWLKDNPELKEKHLPKEPEYKPVNHLQEQIELGIAEEVKHKQYLANLELNKEKEKTQKALTENDGHVFDLRAQRKGLLAEKVILSGVNGLSFDEDGNFDFEDTHPDNMSTSQWMRLNGALASLYPDTLNLELVDCGESLGSGLFDLSVKATKEGKVIMTTVVGENPKEFPEGVEAYTVKKGELKE